MTLVRNGAVVADAWSDATYFTPESWTAARESGRAAKGSHALTLGPDDGVEALGPDAACFGLIAIAFPSFTDGRPYTAARLLRERYGYTGELRATCQVLRDQLFFMVRCGFDTFEVTDAEAFA
jgi:uncharacterized protein (DUF934 family)